jgi:hypothetical protein
VGRKPVDIGRGSWLFGRYSSRVAFLGRLLSTRCSASSGLYPFILLRNILLLTIKSGRCAAKHCLGSASKYSKRSDARKKRNTAGQGRVGGNATNTFALINTRAEVEGKTEVPGAAFAHPTRQHVRDVRATTTGTSGSRRHHYERRQGSGKSCRHRTNEAQVVRVQQVDRSTPGSGHSAPIGSIDDDCWPALTSTTAAGQGSRGNRKPPRCQQGMTPATGFPCPRLPFAWGSPPPHRPLRAVRGPQEGNKEGSLTGPSQPLIAMSRKRQQSNRLKLLWPTGFANFGLHQMLFAAMFEFLMTCLADGLSAVER